MIKSKKQMYIVVGVFALVLMLGTVTYAFFNYTRTGTANTIRTGRISFNTSQSNTLNLTNVFPMSSTDAGNANLAAVSVRIWGDTTYADGEEYEISIVGVNNTIGSGASAKTIPINYIASYSATPVQSGDPNVIGTNSDSYFTARGQSSPVYQLKTTGEATNGEQVLIGYIPSGATGIDGTLTIKAYLDSSKIAISDTYDESDPGTDNMGTTSEWVGDRVVLTTTEWNALQNTQTPLSFKIKAVSQEGTWIEEPTILAADIIKNSNDVVNVADAYRYVGNDVNNFLYFNCSDITNQSSTSCEVWRIIGVYGNNLKIMRNTPLDSQRIWNTIPDGYDNSYRINIWEESNLKTYLNEDYYVGLNSSAKNQIYANGNWLVGSVDHDAIASDAYIGASTSTYINKVGLVASYEYLYAASNTNDCWNTSGYDYDGDCHSEDWMYNSLTSNGSHTSWLISPRADFSSNALMIFLDGYIPQGDSVEVTTSFVPTVYLNSNVTFLGGHGTESDPYTLKYN